MLVTSSHFLHLARLGCLVPGKGPGNALANFIEDLGHCLPLVHKPLALLCHDEFGPLERQVSTDLGGTKVIHMPRVKGLMLPPLLHYDDLYEASGGDVCVALETMETPQLRGHHYC